MSTSQWLLTRMAASESRVCEVEMKFEERLALLDRLSVQRTRLERSFTTALHELRQLQKERRAQPQPPQPADSKPAGQTAPPPAPHSGYVMSEGAEGQPVSCAPVTLDTR